MPLVTTTCPICLKATSKYPKNGIPHIYCSRTCMYVGNRGSGNPNFGKRWSEESRARASKYVSEDFKNNPERRYAAGSANRGKTFSEETCNKMSLARIGKPGRPLSESRKLVIGLQSTEKMGNPIMKARIRKAREDSGNWIKLEDRPDIQQYYMEANWVAGMFDLTVEEEGRRLLSSLGVFHNTKNSKGVVRDHMYGRRSGFSNSVFPEILRHPCNCQIITHANNVGKKRGRYIDANSHSLEDLFRKIEEYSGEWREQGETLKLITDYGNGLRWSNKFKGKLDE